MKKSYLIAILLGLLILATTFQVVAPYLQFQAAVKWEYRIENIPDERFHLDMNALGKDGWEAVSARRAGSGTGENTVFNYEIIFKRQVSAFHKKKD